MSVTNKLGRAGSKSSCSSGFVKINTRGLDP
jgi:hypothetical protein